MYTFVKEGMALSRLSKILPISTLRLSFSSLVVSVLSCKIMNDRSSSLRRLAPCLDMNFPDW